MNFNMIFEDFKKRLKSIRPFLSTKVGRRLGLIFVLLFVLLFFAPAFHGFVGTALFACLGAVYLVLIWRRFDPEHVIVPAVFLTVPMLLDMIIYHQLDVVACLLIAIIAMFVAARSVLIGFFDNITDMLYVYLVALGICVAVVVAACLFIVLVTVAWWILCIVAFLALIGIFMGVIFSTAAYTASDGRRQARKKGDRRQQLEEEEYYQEREQKREQKAKKRYENYHPRQRDTMVYNLDEDDIQDVK